jgi:hypothetical protein
MAGPALGCLTEVATHNLEHELIFKPLRQVFIAQQRAELMKETQGILRDLVDRSLTQARGTIRDVLFHLDNIDKSLLLCAKLGRVRNGTKCSSAKTRKLCFFNLTAVSLRMKLSCYGQMWPEVGQSCRMADGSQQQFPV